MPQKPKDKYDKEDQIYIRKLVELVEFSESEGEAELNEFEWDFIDTNEDRLAFMEDCVSCEDIKDDELFTERQKEVIEEIWQTYIGIGDKERT